MLYDKRENGCFGWKFREISIREKNENNGYNAL